MAEQEETKKELPLSKVLELLVPKVQSGRPLPSALTSPPWRIPSEVAAESAKINAILEKSMEIQSSNIPGSDDFDSFIISNSCLAISGLLKYYFQSASLLTDEVKVVFGVLLWDANARDGPDDFEGTPQVWLDIKDCPIDNTYVALPEESAMHLEYFYKAKKANYYLKTDPITTDLKLYLGSEEAVETTRHNLKVFRTYVSNDTTGNLVEKYLVFALECIGLNPSVKMYDLLMRKYLKEAFNFDIKDLVIKWQSKCWTCFTETCPDLKTCTECKMAKYCGKDCQKSDWKAHKLLHKELELTQQVLSEEQ